MSEEPDKPELPSPRELLGSEVWSELTQKGIDPDHLAKQLSSNVIYGRQPVEIVPLYIAQFIEDTGYDYIWAFSVPQDSDGTQHELALSTVRRDDETNKWVSPHSFDIYEHKRQYPEFCEYESVSLDEFKTWFSEQSVLDGFNLVNLSEEHLASSVQTLVNQIHGVSRFQIQPNDSGSEYELLWENLVEAPDKSDKEFIPARVAHD